MTSEKNFNYLYCHITDLFSNPEDSQQVRDLSLHKIAKYSEIMNSKPDSNSQANRFYRAIAKNTAIEYYRKTTKTL